MTHYERMKAALLHQIPDRVPTLELEFQLAPEFMGKDFLGYDDVKNLSPKEAEKAIAENAEYMIQVYEALEYDAFNIGYLGPYTAENVKRLRQAGGDKFMMFAHGDGTFAIPDGDTMMDFAIRIAEDPESVDEEAERMCRNAIENNRRTMDMGVDCFILCSDYCFNNGPFFSPKMFRRFVTPYLTRIIEDIRAMGGWAIKHTDGDIMPIIDQMVEARPHAIHSLDPMAGVDIKTVKELYGDKVALCGNVNCALLQTGTEEEIRESARYALKYGKPGGGYVYCTSNVPFRGLPLERYMICLEEWKKARDY